MAISFVAKASAAAASVALPAGLQANDVIVVFAYRNALTAPTNASGYTSATTQSANTNSFRVSYKIATGSETSTGTFTNASLIIVHIYRGASGIGGVGSTTTASSTTTNMSGIGTMSVTDGTSWVVSWGGSAQITSMSTPTGLTLRSSQAAASSMGILTDTNGGVSSWTLHTSTNGTAAVNVGGSLELKANKKMSTLTDNFNGAVMDSTKWTNFNTTSQSGGNLVLTTSTTAAVYSGYTSLNRFDFTGAVASWQLVNADIRTLASDEIAFILYNTTSNKLWWFISQTTITAYVTIAGTNTNLFNATYNPAVFQWLRMRESGGTIYWEYSADGLNWTLAATRAIPFDIVNFVAEMSNGTWAVESIQTNVLIDNFNLGPTVTTTQTATARVSNTRTATQTTKATIVQAGSKILTQTATARLSKNFTATQQATARIITNDNRLVNGTFETDLSGWNVYGNTSGISQSTTVARSGTKSLSLNSDGTVWAGAYYTVPSGAVLGDQNIFRIWVKGDSTSVGLSIQAVIKDETSGVLTSSLPVILSDTIWKEVIVTSKMQNTGQLTLHVQGLDLTAGSHVFIDDGTLTYFTLPTYAVSGRTVKKNNALVNWRGWTYSNIAQQNGAGYAWTIEKKQIRYDMEDISSGGSNAIKVFYDGYDANNYNGALDEAYRNGIGVWMNFFVTYNSDYSVATGSANRNSQISAFATMVANLKNHPAIIGFIFGSENNYNLGITSKADWYSLVDAAIVSGKSNDNGNHLFTTSNGEIADIATYDSAVPHLDIWGATLYRGTTFSTLSSDVTAATTRPLLITEYGFDRYNSTVPGEDESGQATRNLALSKEAEGYAVIVGHLIFEFADEWWKMTANGVQDTTGVANANDDRDGMFQEEWFGSTLALPTGSAQYRTKKQSFTDHSTFYTANAYGTGSTGVAKTKTQTSIARVAQTLQKTQPTKARISQSFTKTQGAISRIAQTKTKTQTTIARVARNQTVTQITLARIAKQVTKTQPSIARISNARTKTQTSLGRISNSFTRLQTATAKIIVNIAGSKTQGSISRIAVNKTAAQTTVARISVIKTKTQPTTGRIANQLTKTQTATAAVARVTIKLQTATASIITNSNPLKVQTTIARIANKLTKTQVATARIVVNVTVTKTQTTKARLSRNIAATQTAVARIITNSGISKTQVTTARISNKRSLTQAAKARIVQGRSLTQNTKARISNQRTLQQNTKGRIAVTVNTTTTLKAAISAILSTTQVVTSRISQNFSMTQVASARIVKSFQATKTQTATANIVKNFAATQTATARIIVNSGYSTPVIIGQSIQETAITLGLDGGSISLGENSRIDPISFSDTPTAITLDDDSKITII